MPTALQNFITTLLTIKVEQGVYTTMEKEITWALDEASRCTGGPLKDAWEVWSEANPGARAGLKDEKIRLRWGT